MDDPVQPNPAITEALKKQVASILGAKGGKASTPAKRRAARANAKKATAALAAIRKKRAKGKA